jgi:hypothetical protein
MCRTAILLIVLVTLSVASAYGTPNASAKAPRKTSSSAGVSHRVREARRSQSVSRPSRSHPPSNSLSSRSLSRSRSAASADAAPAAREAKSRPTPAQVGHSAGLKIRQRMAQQRRDKLLARREGERSPAVGRAARFQKVRVLKARNLETSAPEIDQRETVRQTGGQAPYQSPYQTSRPVVDQPQWPSVAEPNSALESDDSTNAARAAALQAQTEQAALQMDREGVPVPLRGSLASLARQDDRLEADGLQRIVDENDLTARIAHKLLVPVPASEALIVNSALPPAHRYCRPWTAHFLADLAHAHDAMFHRPLYVSSAVRPATYQERLMRINGNAAPAEGDIVSPHVMGATVDIAKKGLSTQELVWMRRDLLDLEVAGKIDVEEEFEQSCFHITVYKNYLSPRLARPPVQAEASPAQSSPVASRESRPVSSSPSLRQPATRPALSAPAPSRPAPSVEAPSVRPSTQFRPARSRPSQSRPAQSKPAPPANTRPAKTDEADTILNEGQ